MWAALTLRACKRNAVQQALVIFKNTQVLYLCFLSMIEGDTVSMETFLEVPICLSPTLVTSWSFSGAPLLPNSPSRQLWTLRLFQVSPVSELCTRKAQRASMEMTQPCLETGGGEETQRGNPLYQADGGTLEFIKQKIL